MLDKIATSSSAPVVARWGITPFEDEPAHGFFARLAALNGQASIRPFAMALGINGRNIKPQEMLRFCEELPISGLEHLRKSTPFLGERVVTLRNERLVPGRDWSITQRRYCRSCLLEASYHRYWFDLILVEACPIHNELLQTHTGGFVWSWREELLRHLEAVDGVPARSSEPLGLPAYILGRLGSMPQVCQVELDALPLSQATKLLILIGLLRRNSWKSGLNKQNLRQRQEAAEEGFRFLTAGGSIEALCDEYLHSVPRYGDGTAASKFGKKNLGWASYQAYGVRGEGVPRIADVFDKLMGVARQGRTKHSEKCNRLSERLHIKPSVVRKIVDRYVSGLDMDSKHNEEEVASIIYEVKINLVRAQAFADALGIPVTRLPRLISSGIFEPVVRGYGGERTLFDRRDADGVLNALYKRDERAPDDGVEIERVMSAMKVSFAFVLNSLLNGTFRVANIDMNAVGLSAVRVSKYSITKPETSPDSFKPRKRRGSKRSMPVFEAATYLGTTGITVAKLVQAGVLRPAMIGKLKAVDRQSALDFRRQYATPAMYAAALNCRPKQAAKRLRDLGVFPPAELLSVTPVFIQRQEVENLLCLPRGAYVDSPSAQFFEALEDRLFQLPHGISLRRHPDHRTGLLIDGTRRMRVIVDVEERRVGIKIPIEATRRLKERQALLQQWWPKARFSTLDEWGPTMFEDRCRRDGEDEPVLDWICSRLTDIRRALVSS